MTYIRPEVTILKVTDGDRFDPWTKVELSCGHVASCASHFSFKVGSSFRCSACAKERHEPNTRGMHP